MDNLSTQNQERGAHKGRSEGAIAKTIEDQTAKLPSDTFLWLALGSMALSLGFQAAGQKDKSIFVGQWVPTFLIFGVYNKIVKVAGSDQREHRSARSHEVQSPRTQAA